MTAKDDLVVREGTIGSLFLIQRDKFEWTGADASGQTGTRYRFFDVSVARSKGSGDACILGCRICIQSILEGCRRRKIEWTYVRQLLQEWVESCLGGNDELAIRIAFPALEVIGREHPRVTILDRFLKDMIEIQLGNGAIEISAVMERDVLT